MIKIHSFESMGTYDGPGLRLVVFLQGCPFKCIYCANPDTISFDGGTPTEEQEIIRRAVSEKPFFGKRGGVTFSGGEPTAQAKELIPVFEALHGENIHICLDTNGGIWNDDVEKLLELTDLVLLDIKEFNNQRHRHITGRNTTQTIETASRLRDMGKKVWLRYVLVPGLSDFEEDIRALGEFFGRNSGFKNIERVEILPYHTLGVNKYESLGMEYRIKDTPLNTREQLDRAKELFDEYFDCAIVN